MVGHSLGGIAITQAAENCPQQVRARVYLCAFLPRDGESLITWASQDQESIVNPMTIDPLADGVLGFKPEFSREAFYGNCTDEDAALAQSRFVTQSGAPLGTPVKTSLERWGRIPRYYIECARGRAVTLKLQREMQKHSPCQQAFSIDTGHSPFFSAKNSLRIFFLGSITAQRLKN